MSALRNLVLVFGDQLDWNAALFDDFDLSQDAVWMAEVTHESKYVWSHKQRIVMFLSAMRHFRDELSSRGYRVEYTELDASKQTDKFSNQLAIDLRALKPKRVLMTEPGEWRVREGVKQVCERESIALDILEDRHFYTTLVDFKKHAQGRKSLRMEYFYREQRKRFGILMDEGEPAGGAWNFDKSNRKPFGRSGPDLNTAPRRFEPDDLTREVIELVERRFKDHPGELDTFDWPVTRADALRALEDFVNNRLDDFGAHQDAMWYDAPWLNHSLLSASMNLKLLNPREVVGAAEEAYQKGAAPIESVEGFVRQILGWREYVRGIYWMEMPSYLKMNTMGAGEPLPDFYWTGDVEFNCLKQVVDQTLKHGYAHHIQRLMVTGLYALLLGVKPRAVHEWYLAVYVDAVEWVELPNTLGMSQYADGGLMASKPYVATGKYIQKMSNYCEGCPRNPAERTGSDACPFTTLYWDYLIRHQDRLSSNSRISLQLRNLERLNSGDRSAVARCANELRKNPAGAISA